MIVHNGNILVNNGRWINCSQPYSIKRHVNILSTTGGTITAEPVEGYDGTVVKLSHTDNPYYTFINYTVSGARLYNDRYFRFEGSDVTVSGTWQFSTKWLCDNWVNINGAIWTSKNLEIDDGGEGIYKVDNVTNSEGINFGTQYYYTRAAAKRIVDSIPGWSIPRRWYLNSDPLYWRRSTWESLANHNVTGYPTVWKSTYGWYVGSNHYNGTNTTGFNALPIGYIHKNTVVTELRGVGSNCQWWSADGDGTVSVTEHEYIASYQYDDAYISGDNGYHPNLVTNPNNPYASIRLVKDDGVPPVCV